MKHVRYFIYGAVLIVGALYLRGCFKAPEPPAIPSVTTQLAPNEQERIVLTPHTLTHVTPKGVTTTYVPDGAPTTITVKRTGEVVTSVQTRGFSRRFGLGVVVIDRVRPEVDLQWGYWGRFGSTVGLALGKEPVVVPYLALTYSLDQLHLNNTHIVLGVSARKEAVVGLRVAF